MNKYFGRKTTLIVSLLVLAAIILSACDAAAGATPAPTATPECADKIGYSPDGTTMCDGYFKRLPKTVLDQCDGKTNLTVPGDYTWNGKEFVASCTIVIDAFNRLGAMDLATVGEPEEPAAPEETAEPEEPAETEEPAMADGSEPAAEVPACASTFSAYLDLVGQMTDAQLRDYQAACGVSFESASSRNAQPAALGSNLDYGSWEYFAQFSTGLTEADMHGILIDKLNALYVGISRDFDGNTHIVTGDDEVMVIMAGLYTVPDITFNGQAFPYLVEGRTGVFVAMPGSDFVIPGANASFPLTGWTGETAPRMGPAALVMGHIKAEACAPVSDVVDALDAYAGTPDLFEAVDKIVADHPTANIGYGYASVIENAEAGKTFAWGSLERSVGAGWNLVSSADGMGLYVADGNGKREVFGPNGAVQTCGQLQNYASYPAAEVGTRPSMQRACVKNTTAAETFNRYWDDPESLFAAMSLWPMSIYAEPIDDRFDAKWNTLVIGRDFVDGMPETDVLMPFSMTDGLGAGNNEFGGSAFIKTDGTAQIEGPYGVINFCDGPFSPADSIDGWGK